MALYFMYQNFARVHQTLRVTPAMEAGGQIMSGVSKKSLASWRDAHGFGILCIRGPLGERFVVVPSEDSLSVLQDASAWMDTSESALRSRLKLAELSDAEIDEAVDLARAWATTFEAREKRSGRCPGRCRIQTDPLFHNHRQASTGIPPAPNCACSSNPRRLATCSTVRWSDSTSPAKNQSHRSRH